MAGSRPIAARRRAAFVGIAGWAIRPEHRDLYGKGGSHLARYATRFNAVEINSCFYRPHREKTYARWAESVPEHFRFAVKIPRTISHELKLVDCCTPLDAFLAQTGALGAKRGALLLQLPPKGAYDAEIARRFFGELRERYDGTLVFEPRHASWFTEEAEQLLLAHRIARVAADPAPVPAAGRPAGWPGVTYYRLHGSPRMYYSASEPAFRDTIAAGLRQVRGEAWCIFDNTARGAAVPNALALQALLESDSAPRLTRRKDAVSSPAQLDSGRD